MTRSAVLLGEFAPIEYGKALPASSRRGGAVPVYASAGCVGWHNAPIVDGPAVIIGRKGNVGSVFYSPEASYPIDTVFFTQGSPGADLRFVYYLLIGLRLQRFRRDSAVPGLNRDVYNAIEIDVPNLEEQRAIAEVLGALDDKIAANERLVATADGLRLARYGHAARDGVEVPLSSLARFVNGKAFTKGASGTGRVVIRIAELNSGVGSSTVFNDIQVADDHLARPGDLLFAWSGSLTVRRWYRPEAIVNQHIFKVVPVQTPLWLIEGALQQKLADFRRIAADKATTMGHIQRRHLDELVRVPSASAQGTLDAALTALWDRALATEVENLRLAELRDTLLPGLMSGRITVKHAEATVSEAI